jgi:hypothetical protein
MAFCHLLSRSGTPIIRPVYHTPTNGPTVDWVVLDWTRMGRTYCLAGVVLGPGGDARVLRPLPAHARDAPVRNVGWPPELLAGRGRWELFELVGPAAADPRRPHLEDVWVEVLRPQGRRAPPEVRQHLLELTRIPAGQPLFGAALTRTRTALYLAPDTGCRSLATVVASPHQLAFRVSHREGTPEPDYRVCLDLPGLEGAALPVKDHFLLARVEREAPDPPGRCGALERVVGQMGPQVAVRLGLSRPFQATGRGPGACWLMADGFYCLTDPGP